jgi:molecular chaperone GrpE (heat shock protein)
MVDAATKSRHKRRHRSRSCIIRGGNMTSSSPGLLLVLLVMIFASHIDFFSRHCCYCDALKFGFGGNNNKKDDDNNEKKEDDTKTTTPPSTTSTPTPTTILETEARTARELSKSISTLQKQLSTCNDRISSITSAFQNLYSLHLKHIDGLRKCKEGMISGRDLQDLLDATPTVVDNDGDGDAATTKKGQKEISKTFQTLLNQAHITELNNQRTIQNEEIATKHKQLIHKLESQIHQLKLRETAWERTISELVARKDILERRETAWTRTISELMVDIEIRNKRENWWSVMNDEMRSRIGGLSYMAVLER